MNLISPFCLVALNVAFDTNLKQVLWKINLQIKSLKSIQLVDLKSVISIQILDLKRD